jgi:virginiamycin B lyase
MNMNMTELKPGSPATLGIITEYSLAWPNGLKASTHELVVKGDHIYVTGQNNDLVARFNTKTTQLEYFSMASGILKPEIETGNGPHGLLIDGKGNVWVSLEFKGTVARLDDDGKIVEEIDVKMHVKSSNASGSVTINTAPHGICIGADGATIWFTGKRTSTVGRINPDKSVEHFQLNTLSSLPIFLSAGPDNCIWGTELFGSNILHISESGHLNEYKIPTANSRPIGVIPDPSGKYMWFTEETGVKIGRIDMKGNITEFAIPSLQKNDILGSLCFDSDQNLWVEVYADCNNPVADIYKAPNHDYIIKIDKGIRDLGTNDISGISFTPHTLPSKMAMLHRIKMADDGNLWFTEMMTDRIGKIAIGK